MFKIELKTEDLARAVGARMEDVLKAAPAILDSQADLAANMWRAAASGRVYPGMTRKLVSVPYQSAISRGPVEVEGGALQVRVFAERNVAMPTGKPWDVVASIEKGWGPFDMKPGLLRGRDHAVIPFSHQAKSLTKAARDAAASGGLPHLENPFNVSMKTAKTYGPLRYKYVDGLSRASFSQSLGGGLTLRTEGASASYTWRNRMFEGLVRSGAKGHSQYTTFRTVSRKSDPNSWLMPKVPANPVFRAVTAAVGPVVRANIEAAFSKL